QKQSGYVKEANGRFRFENLSERVLKGQASAEEAEEVAQMTSWHEFAGPIFKAAEDQVSATFGAGFRASIDATIKSEKLESAAAERLWKATDPIRQAI